MFSENRQQRFMRILGSIIQNAMHQNHTRPEDLQVFVGVSKQTMKNIPIDISMAETGTCDNCKLEMIFHSPNKERYEKARKRLCSDCFIGQVDEAGRPKLLDD